MTTETFVSAWLCSISLPQYIHSFETAGIKTENDLRRIYADFLKNDLNIASFPHREKILTSVSHLKSGTNPLPKFNVAVEYIDDEFKELLDKICEKLDNIGSHIYMDDRCIFYTKPKLAANPAYYADAAAAPKEQDVPLLTPYADTETWSKVLFDELFTECAENLLDYKTNANFMGDLTKNLSDRLRTLRQIHSGFVEDPIHSFTQCVFWARAKFEELFYTSMMKMKDSLYVNGKVPTPIRFNRKNPLHQAFIITASHLRATSYGLHSTHHDFEYFSRVLQGFVLDPYLFDPAAAQKSDQEQCEWLLAQLPPPSTQSRMQPIHFNDESKLHTDFLHAVSHLHAINFNYYEEELSEAERELQRKREDSVFRMLGIKPGTKPAQTVPISQSDPSLSSPPPTRMTTSGNLRAASASSGGNLRASASPAAMKQAATSSMSSSRDIFNASVTAITSTATSADVEMVEDESPRNIPSDGEEKEDEDEEESKKEPTVNDDSDDDVDEDDDDDESEESEESDEKSKKKPTTTATKAASSQPSAKLAAKKAQLVAMKARAQASMKATAAKQTAENRKFIEENSATFIPPFKSLLNSKSSVSTKTATTVKGSTTTTRTSTTLDDLKRKLDSMKAQPRVNGKLAEMVNFAEGDDNDGDSNGDDDSVSDDE